MKAHLFFATLLCCTTLGAGETERLETLQKFAASTLAQARGDTHSAQIYAEKALALTQNSLRLIQSVATLHMQQGDPRSASLLYQNFAKAHPNSFPAQTSLAAFLISHSPNDSVATNLAEKALIIALELQPESTETSLQLIALYQNQSNPDSGLSIVHRLIDNQELSASRSYSLLRSLLPIDTVDEELASFAAELATKPIAHAQDALFLSEQFRKTGDVQTAAKILADHCEANPSSLDLRTRLGIYHFLLKNDDLALKELHQVLEIDDRQTKAHSALAQYYLRNERRSEAFIHRRAVLQHDGGSASRFLDLAKDLEQSGDQATALTLLRDGRFYHPQDVSLAMALGDSLMTTNLTQEAAQLYREVEYLAKESQNPADEDLLDSQFQLNVARTFIEQSDFDSAEARLRTAIKSSPPDQTEDSADALTLLAKLWIQQKKNLPAARSLLRRAQHIHPDHNESAKLLLSLPEPE